MEASPGYKLVEDTFYEHEKCGLTEIDFLNVIDPWYAISKNSPYKEILKVKYVHDQLRIYSSWTFNFTIIYFDGRNISSLFRVREYGIQARENKKIYRKRPICDAQGKTFDSVRLIDCYAALLMLLYGFSASLLIMGLEIVAKWQKGRKVSTRRSSLSG